MAKSKTPTPETASTAPVSVKRTTCPITREHFAKHAKPIDLGELFKGHIAAVQRADDGTVGFSTGSLGFRFNEKITIDIGGVLCSFQCQGNIILVNSKDLPK